MRTTMIPDSDYRNRIERLQAAMAEVDLDVLITYSSESESASSRYLADFWPFFDFAGIIVPRQGEPALVTGGPESYEFAKQFSRIKDIRIHPAFVESSAPDWVPPVTYEDFDSILTVGLRTNPGPHRRHRLEYLPPPHSRRPERRRSERRDHPRR